MTHTYDFFDRGIFDGVWQLSWAEFLRKYGTRWALNRRYGPGSYDGKSLRGLIAFTFEPEPSAERVEDILKHQTIRWTIRRSSPQLFAIASIIWDGLPQLQNGALSLSTKDNEHCLFAAAVHAYFEGRITRAALRAVLKMHSVAEPSEFVQLTRKEKQRLASANLSRAMWEPIYSWQGEQWLD